jgi:hypothetical protein
MAIRKSSRSRPEGARSPRSYRAVLPRPPGTALGGSHTGALVCSVEQFRRLSLLLPRLRTIYGTALTAELALRHQAAEQDSEVADCLRVGVCDPIADQVRELEDLVLQFCTAMPEGEP